MSQLLTIVAGVTAGVVLGSGCSVVEVVTDPAAKATGKVLGGSSADDAPNPYATAAVPACTSDSVCGDRACSAFGQCEAPIELSDLRISWDIGGQVASWETCDAITEVDFLLQDGRSTPPVEATFGPAACVHGTFVIHNVTQGAALFVSPGGDDWRQENWPIGGTLEIDLASWNL
jgi:hypothetical protein